MKLHQLHFSRRSRRLNAGFTLIEISLVIALLLGLIAVVFMGLGTYKEGADKAKCRMQLASVQKAVRSHANMQNLAIGAPLASTAVFGAGLMMASAPVCPAGATYTWDDEVPAVGTPYGTCGNTVPSHALATADTTDW